MAQASPRPTTHGDSRSPAEVAREAFRELHGRRLHGFALLLTLGDRALAAGLTADALAAAAGRTPELRHPERAAAWLRAHVVHAMPRRHQAPSPADEGAVLDPLGVDRAVATALAALKVPERAAVVAADVERLDPRDVETVTGRRGAALERLLADSRRRYIDAYASTPSVAAPGSDGLLVRRIRAVAARTMT